MEFSVNFTSQLGEPPFMTSMRLCLSTADSAATAAAVLLVGTLLQSPSANTLAAGREGGRVGGRAVHIKGMMKRSNSKQGTQLFTAHHMNT